MFFLNKRPVADIYQSYIFSFVKGRVIVVVLHQFCFWN